MIGLGPVLLIPEPDQPADLHARADDGVGHNVRRAESVDADVLSGQGIDLGAVRLVSQRTGRVGEEFL